jgi:hypothetical protein
MNFKERDGEMSEIKSNDCFRDFAKEIAEYLEITRDEVSRLSIEEINALSLEKSRKMVDERMQDEKYKKIFKCLLDDFDYLYSKLGDNLYRGCCQNNWTRTIELTSSTSHDYEHASEEEKEILFVVADKKNNSYYYRYGQNEKYKKYKLMNYGARDSIKHAIELQYPYLKEYEFETYFSGYDGRNTKMQISLPSGFINDQGEERTMNIYCSLEALLEQDVEKIVEDHLNYCSFETIKSKDEDDFKLQNRFFNLDSTREFLEKVKKAS